MATSTAQRQEWEAFLRAHPFQQFGQGDDEYTFNGATGCTHTDLQKLVLAKTKHLFSHDEISKIAGYPPAGQNPKRRGLRWSMDPNCEVMKVVRHFNLPYEPYFVNSFLTTPVWNKVKAAAEHGPIMIAVKYSHWPEHKGTVYNGVKADGKPNGYALVQGKTQLVGFENGAHAVLWVAYWKSSTYGDQWVVDAFDPNHGSPSRPEKPPFDRFTTAQLQTAINSIRLLTANGQRRSLAFLIPTKTFHP